LEFIVKMSHDDEVLNSFGEPVHKTDLFSRFEWLSEGEGRVRKRQFESRLISMGLSLDKAEAAKMFRHIDVSKSQRFNFENFEQAFKDEESWTENLREFFSTLLSCAYLYDPGIATETEEMSVADIQKLLENKRGKWTLRVQAMRDFVKKASRQKISDEKFEAEFRKVKESFCTQLKDGRSALVREATMALGQLALIRPNAMTRWSSRLLEVLFECVRIKIEVISMSADDCIKCFIKNVPDSRRKYPILSRLLAGCKDNNVELRRYAIKYLTIVVDQYITECGSFPKTIWGRLEKLINSPKSGIQDADQRVRFSAYGLLFRGELSRLPEAQRIASKLIGVPKKTYEAQKNKLRSAGCLPDELPAGRSKGYSIDEAKLSSSSLKEASSSRSTTALPKLKQSISLPVKHEQKIKTRLIPSISKPSTGSYDMATPFLIPDAFNFDMFSSPKAERKAPELEKKRERAISQTSGQRIRRMKASAKASSGAVPRSSKASTGGTPRSSKTLESNRRGRPKRGRKTPGVIEDSDLRPKTLRFRNGSSLPKQNERSRTPKNRTPNTRKKSHSQSPVKDRQQRIKLRLNNSNRSNLFSSSDNLNNQFKRLSLANTSSAEKGRKQSNSVGSKPMGNRSRSTPRKFVKSGSLESLSLTNTSEDEKERKKVKSAGARPRSNTSLLLTKKSNKKGSPQKRSPTKRSPPKDSNPRRIVWTPKMSQQNQRDDGFRIYSSGFPVPSKSPGYDARKEEELLGPGQVAQNRLCSLQNKNEKIQSAISEEEATIQKDKENCVYLVVQLEDYTDCFYPLRPCLTATIGDIKNYIARDVLDPCFLSAKFRGEVVGNNSTLHELGVKDSETLYLHIEQTRIENDTCDNIPEVREKTESFPLSSISDVKGRLITNKLSGIQQIFIEYGRAYNQGPELPDDTLVPVEKLYEDKGYAEIIWEGVTRRVILSNTSQPDESIFKFKKSDSSEIEEYEIGHTRKITMQEADNFRGIIRNKMRTTRPTKLFQNKDSIPEEDNSLKEEKGNEEDNRQNLDVATFDFSRASIKELKIASTQFADRSDKGQLEEIFERINQWDTVKQQVDKIEHQEDSDYSVSST